MGIPYSREINAALNQTKPLVAEGFKVLQTTKNISTLLAVIQILTVVLLTLILLALLAILVSLNPHLEGERDVLITPVLRWGCEMSIRTGSGVVWLVWTGVVGGLVGSGLGIWWTAKVGEEKMVDGQGECEERAGTGEGQDGDRKAGEAKKDAKGK